VLLAKDPEGVSEVVNDLSGELTTFWQVLADPILFQVLKRYLEAVPVSQEIFEQSMHERAVSAPVNAAWFFIKCRQSMAGRMQSFSPITRTRTRRGMNENASAWISAIDGLAEVHARLRRVVILNDDALHVIKSQDGPATLFYLDPPYLHETRAGVGQYAYEMVDDQHEQLLRLLKTLTGKFMLSGYRSELYDRYAKEAGWNRIEFQVANHAASGKSKRKMIECLWVNY
jgi:DNA adenine methylase